MLNNKKIATGFICAGLAAIVAAVIVSAVFRGPDYSTVIPEALDEAVALSTFTRQNVSLSDIVIDGKTCHYAPLYESSAHMGGECMGEGHEILGYTKKGESVDVYALCGYTCFGIRDDLMVDESGAGSVPVLLTFDRVRDGDTYSYRFKSAKDASDGGEFVSSVKEMFPPALAQKAISAQGDSETFMRMEAQCNRYAYAYLKSIGRDILVSRYDYEAFRTLSQLGVSAEVGDTLYSLHPEFGLYVGKFETLENGVRYVYSVDLESIADDGNGTVTYLKTEYDSGRVIEKYVYTVKGDSFTEVKPKKKKK